MDLVVLDREHKKGTKEERLVHFAGSFDRDLPILG